ncbi:MAG TPA: TonB family protein [Terriglobia bacterium]|nr:TonB family protein [Terriglobia bacterium]
MSAEPSLNLLLEWENEVARWRRRTMLLISIFLHILLVLVIVLAPDLFRRGAEMMGITVQPKPKLQTTYLFIPPDLLKRLHESSPKTNVLSDKNRRAQGRSPVVNPNGLKMPYSRGNTPLPELKGGSPKPTPPAPPAPAPAPPAAAQSSPPAGGEKSAEAKAAPPPKKPDDHPQLLDVPAPPAGGEISSLRLPLSSPGEDIRQSAAAAARGRASGVGGGAGDSPGQFQNINPNFSTEGPLILSDTRGVDFGPYLARVVSAVRRNWYAVIPESARLGQKGRVAVVFEILKDGSVPQLRLVSSSGAGPLDRAALSGIRASVPFDPLPPEFTGNHLVLQFIFLYNLGYGSP